MLASDYSRGTRGRPFECFTFLVADPGSFAAWNAERQAVRQSFLPDGRRMAYKSLGDRHRAAALVPFLQAADRLSGLLVTFALDTQLIAELSEVERSEHPCGADPSQWRPRTLARLAMITKLAALLLGGLASPGQNVLWISDEDDVLADDTRTTQATALFGHYISLLSPVGLGHLRLGSTAVDDGSLLLEDLAAISDLTAGAMAVVVNEEMTFDHRPNEGLSLPMSQGARLKARYITNWFAHAHSSLSRAGVYLLRMSDGTTRSGALTIDSRSSGPEGLLIPRRL